MSSQKFGFQDADAPTPNPGEGHGNGGHHPPPPPPPPNGGREEGIFAGGMLAFLLITVVVIGVIAASQGVFALAAGFCVIVGLLLVSSLAVLLLALAGGGKNDHAHAHGGANAVGHKGHVKGIHADDMGIVKIPDRTSGPIPMDGNFSVPVIRSVFLGHPREFFPWGKGTNRMFRFGQYYVVIPWLAEAFFVDASEKKLPFTLRLAPGRSPIIRGAPGNAWVRARGGQNLTPATVDALTGAHDAPMSEAVQTVIGQVATHFEAEMPQEGINVYLNSKENEIRLAINRELHHYGVEVTRLHFDAVNDEVAARAAAIQAMVEKGVNPTAAATMSGGSGGGNNAGSGSSNGFGSLIEAAIIGGLQKLAGGGNNPPHNSNPPSDGGSGSNGGGTGNGTRRRRSGP